jgi:hypothetical protein
LLVWTHGCCFRGLRDYQWRDCRGGSTESQGLSQPAPARLLFSLLHLLPSSCHHLPPPTHL